MHGEGVLLLREGIQSLRKKTSTFMSENFNICQSREIRTARPPASSSAVIGGQPTASAASRPRLPLSERGACRSSVLPTPHLPEDAGLARRGASAPAAGVVFLPGVGGPSARTPAGR